MEVDKEFLRVGSGQWAVGSGKLEAGSWKLEAGSWNWELGTGKWEVAATGQKPPRRQRSLEAVQAGGGCVTARRAGYDSPLPQ